MNPNKITYPLANIWAVYQPRFKIALDCLASPAALHLDAPEVDPGIPMSIANGIARIELTGVMTKRASIFQEFFGGISTEQLGRAVEAAAAADNVEGIFLLVDSPGGSVDGLADFGDIIFEARKHVRIHAHVMGIAASAAYYAASQAHQITAGRMDMIGNIGTKWTMYDDSQAFENDGVRAIAIDSGKFKSIGDAGLPITDEHEAHIQELVNAMFADFVQVIVRGRNMSKSDVMQLADGKIFMAKDALDNGLIDGIATIDQAESALRDEINGGPRGGSNKSATSGINSRQNNHASNGRGVAKGENKMSGETNNESTNRADDVTQSVATVAQLKAAFPKANSDFVVSCLEKNMSLDNAKDAWMTELATQNKALTEAAAKATAMAQEAKNEAAEAKSAGEAKRPGVPAISGGANASTLADGGDAASEWHEAIKEQMDRGKSKPAAVAHVRQKNPELRERYVNQYNAEHGRAVTV